MSLHLISLKSCFLALVLCFSFTLTSQNTLAEDKTSPSTTATATINPTVPADAPTPNNKTQNIMQISIHVDEIDKDITIAKNRAIRQAEMKGLWQVLEHIDKEHAKEMYGTLSADDIHDMVEAIKPFHEVITGGRYQADVQIRFDELRVHALKRQTEGITPQISATNTGVGTLLIIPIMQNAKSELLLWQDNNHWRDALNLQTLELGKGKLIMPFGDPTDHLMLDQETMLAGDIKTLQKIATRYGARNVVIALAKVRAANAKATMFTADIFLRRAGATTEEAKLHYETIASENEQQMLNRAALEVTQKLSNSVNQFALFEEAEASRLKGLVMRINYDTPDKWLALKGFMENLPTVNYLEVGAVSPTFSQITLYYRGSSIPIKQALEDQGTIIKDTDKFWVVTIPSKSSRN